MKITWKNVTICCYIKSKFTAGPSVIPATWDKNQKYLKSEANLARPHLKNKKTRDMVQVTEYLHSMHKALGSSLSTEKKEVIFLLLFLRQVPHM
jgi:hypothetical protein